MSTERNYTGFWIKDAIATVSCVALLLSSLSACNDSTNPAAQAPQAAPTEVAVAESFSLNSLLNSLEGATSGVQNAVAPHAGALQERTKEEVEKLFQWEYRVIEVAANMPATDFEGQLAKLGAEGWECFHIASQTADSTRITCKRRPKSALSYLKYLPGL
jgi:hypothetical protein